ncbi:hypothetical protein Tco_0220522, partial [Tanacetum coccineum]
NSDCNNVASIGKDDRNTSPETMIGARYRRRRWDHVSGDGDRNRLPKTMIGGRHRRWRSEHIIIENDWRNLSVLELSRNPD